MAKLTTLKPLVSTLPPRVGRMPADEQERNRQRYTNEPWRKWYNTTRWKALRIQTFIKDHFTCRICSVLEGNTSKLICDHIEPHKGDERLFWDEENLQTLCKPCHDRVKQKEERRFR